MTRLPLLLVCLALAATAHAQSGNPSRPPIELGERVYPVKPGDDFGKGARNQDTPRIVMPTLKGRAPQPDYPAEALRARIEGSVTFDIVVAADGVVTATRLAKTRLNAPGVPPVSQDLLRALVDAAELTARRWTFEPAKLDGAAVPVVVQLELAFRTR
jgi:outer membrane biosynthesis protein TonB